MTKRWPNIRPLTDEEEAEIQRAIASDPDTFEASEQELNHVYTFSEFLAVLKQEDAGSGKIESQLDASVK